jgi:ribose transport system ATP-binding protein
MDTEILQLSGVSKRFGATAALSGVDLEVRAGEVHALIGENGAGKSTLLNILAGAFPPDAGTMRLDGRAFAPRNEADARRRGVAHIHQELSLCPHLSIAENVLLGAEPARGGRVDFEAMESRAAEILAELGREGLDPRRRVAELGLPDRQSVEICRALAADARIILMDEPTSRLPRESVARLFEVIGRLRRRGLAVLYVSHFLEEVREIADGYTVLRDGRSVASGAIADVTDAELVERMLGHAAAPPLARAAGREIGEVLLEAEGVSLPPRLVSASLMLRRGEILGIAGLVGSGRTELLRCLFGLERPARGRIRLRGREISAPRLSSRNQIRGGVGFLSEDRQREGLALPMSIADNVTLTRLEACSRAGWIDLGRQDAAADRAIRPLRVRAPGPRAPVVRLSGGNQQKVAVARLLHQDPDVLLLDEPARGVDVGAREDIFREIAALAQSGKAVVMVSSYVPELLEACDTIAVMRRGRLSPARPVSAWTAESILERAVGSG